MFRLKNGRSSGSVLGWSFFALGIVLIFAFVIQQNGKKQKEVENGASDYQHPRPSGDGENVGTEAPPNQINDYVGTWMGGIQQGSATMPFKFQFNEDMTCTIWPADLPTVNTTYKIIEEGKFLALYNNGTEAFQGSASQGETGKFLDFCYLGEISKDSTGKKRAKTQMCGTAQKR